MEYTSLFPDIVCPRVVEQLVRYYRGHGSVPPVVVPPIDPRSAVVYGCSCAVYLSLGVFSYWQLVYNKPSAVVVFSSQNPNLLYVWYIRRRVNWLSRVYSRNKLGVYVYYVVLKPKGRMYWRGVLIVGLSLKSVICKGQPRVGG